MSTIEDIEHKINQCLFDEIDKTKIEKLYIQLFCSNCKNLYCQEGCCSQSRNVVYRPIKVVTEEIITEQICDIYFTELTPLVFITLEEYLNNLLEYDYYSVIKNKYLVKGAGSKSSMVKKDYI